MKIIKTDEEIDSANQMRYSKCNDRYFVKSYRFCFKPYLTQDLSSASLTQPYMK